MSKSIPERHVAAELICPSSTEFPNFAKEELSQLLESIYKVSKYIMHKCMAILHAIKILSL